MAQASAQPTDQDQQSDLPGSDYQSALATLASDQGSLDTEAKSEGADSERLYKLAQSEQQQLGSSESQLEGFEESGAKAEASSAPPAPPPQKQANILNRLAPLMLLSAFGGRSAKLSAQSMLGATSGTIQGYLAGNAQAMQQQQAAYDQEYKRWEDQQKQFDKVYGMYLDAYKGHVDAEQRALDATLKTMDEVDTKRRMTLQDKLNIDRARAQVVSQHENAQATGYYRQMELNLQTKKAEQQAATEKNQDVGDGIVSMIALGVPVSQALPGYGQKAAQMRVAAQQQAIARIVQELGVDETTAGQVLARRQQVFKGAGASVTQQTQMLGATRQSLAQLEYNVKMAVATMQQMPSSDLSPITNAITRGAQKWTGDPKYAALFYYMNGVATESARILSGGQASRAQLAEGAREEAEKWASINMTPDSFINGVAPAMVQEAQNRVLNFTDAIKAQLRSEGSDFGATPGERQPPATEPPGAGGAAGQPPPARGKGTVSAAAVKQYAAQQGVPEQQARQFLQSQGYTVQ